MNQRPARFILAVCLSAGAATHALAGNWPRFRGPNGTGVAAEPSNPPTAISENSVRWRVTLPGAGHASPAVWDGKLFTTVASKETGLKTLICLSTDNGSILWQKDFPGKPFKQHPDNLLANATPAVDKDAIYVYFVTADRVQLAAVSHAGEQLWSLDLGPHKSQHGNGCSPMLFEELVIVSHDQEGPTSFLAAFDRRTGKEIWRTQRKGTSASSSTPCIYNNDGQSPQLIVTGRTEGVVAYDPRTGRRLWNLPDAFDRRVIASPVVAGELIIGNCGEGPKGTSLVAVRPPTTPDGAPSLAYRIKENPPYVSTPFYKDGLLYMWADAGVVTCVDAPTGKPLWSGRLEKSEFYSSPVYANGHLYAISKKGDLFVVKLSREGLNVVSQFALGDRCQTTAAIADDRIYVRTLSQMICIGGK